MLVCDKCGAGIIGGSKFCPQCGDPVTEADKVAPIADKSHIANVEISFGTSSSANYQKAVEICQNIPSYSSTGEGKQVMHKITLPITEVELLINLYELVGSWKSSQMLINGHTSTKKSLVYYGVGCYRERQKAYKPEQYCFGESQYEYNIWGCKKLNMPVYEWGGGWLDYGEFSKSGVWQFDKQRIKHDLELAINENELCPILDRHKVIETLGMLPETINPKTDKNWGYRISYEEVNGKYKEVAVGIKPMLKKINRYIIGDFKPKWVVSEETSSRSENVIRVQVDTSDLSSRPKVKKRSKNSSVSWIWWIIIGAIILYFLSR